MRVSIAALLVLYLGACSSSNKDRPTPRSDPAALANRPDSEASVNQPDPTAAAPLCVSLADLERHEGARVRVQGTFRFPTEPAFARNKLILDDGTTVILARPQDAKLAESLREANQGKRMTIRGLIFIKAIPEKYKIIGRTPDPYLLDIEAVDVG